nr:hypothetical protein Iba_chr05cCG16150 [Ipomoea batatas]
MSYILVAVAVTLALKIGKDCASEFQAPPPTPVLWSRGWKSICMCEGILVAFLHLQPHVNVRPPMSEMEARAACKLHDNGFTELRLSWRLPRKPRLSFAFSAADTIAASRHLRGAASGECYVLGIHAIVTSTDFMVCGDGNRSAGIKGVAYKSGGFPASSVTCICKMTTNG